MPTLSITVDAAVADRVAAAYGVATNQLKTAIVSDIKQKVVNYESTQAVKTEQAKVSAAQVSADTAVKAAQTKADSEITIS